MIGLIFKSKEKVILKSLITQESAASQIPQIGDYVDFGDLELGRLLVVSRIFLYEGKKKEVRNIEIQVG